MERYNKNGVTVLSQHICIVTILNGQLNIKALIMNNTNNNNQDNTSEMGCCFYVILHTNYINIKGVNVLSIFVFIIKIIVGLELSVVVLMPLWLVTENILCRLGILKTDQISPIWKHILWLILLLTPCLCYWIFLFYI